MLRPGLNGPHRPETSENLHENERAFVTSVPAGGRWPALTEWPNVLMRGVTGVGAAHGSATSIVASRTEAPSPPRAATQRPIFSTRALLRPTPPDGSRAASVSPSRGRVSQVWCAQSVLSFYPNFSKSN